MRISIEMEPRIKEPRVSLLEDVSTYASQSFGIDERRFIDPNIQQRNGTRMTRIGRVFTDPRASSAQSVFYRSPSSMKYSLSAFIHVHPRLINCVGGV